MKITALYGRLSRDKVTHISRRTTREKPIPFLSAEATQQGRLTFDIVYDRQQMADHLCIEHAAMSAELSKLQKRGCFVLPKKSL